MTETTNLHLKKPENSDFVNVADLNYNSDILDETIHQIQEDIKGDIDTSAYATAISMTLNSDTYVISAFLTNKDGETLGTPQTIDLPLETMVVNGTYDNTTKKVILTLKNGNAVEFSVADLVSGLQSEITSSNKLNSDLISDTNQNNKFVTSAEKTAWTAKQSALTSAQLTAVNSGIDSSKVSQIEKNKDALAELIDSGQKNLLQNTETSRTISGVTFTVNPDNSVSLSGTASADITTYRIITEAPALSGDMVLSGCPSGGANNTYKLDILNGLGGGILANDYGSGAVIDWSKFTTGKFTVRIRIQQGTNVDGLIFKPMICSKAAWDISQKYVPYRPSYDELVARITALENA